MDGQLQATAVDASPNRNRKERVHPRGSCAIVHHASEEVISRNDFKCTDAVHKQLMVDGTSRNGMHNNMIVRGSFLVSRKFFFLSDVTHISDVTFSHVSLQLIGMDEKVTVKYD